MSEPTSLQRVEAAALLRRESSLKALPVRQASWILTQVVVVTGLALTGLWASEPSLALSIALGAGVVALNPRRWWSLPIALAAVALSGLAFEALRWPAILGAGAMAGLLAAWILPQTTDWLDYLNSALATAAGASIGLWAALSLVPSATAGVLGASLTGAVVGLVAAQGIVPLAIRFDTASLPSARAIQKALAPPYREPVFKAFDLYRGIEKKAPDRETRHGLCEVATWVFRLQVTLQTLDKELDTIDPDETNERIRAAEEADGGDTFTRERRQATAAHLRRLLDHRSAIDVERSRSGALVDYALAFLEEARAGLAVAQELPGETTPDRLVEVLHRLRSHAADGDARRRTARELGQLQV